VYRTLAQAQFHADIELNVDRTGGTASTDTEHWAHLEDDSDVACSGVHLRMAERADAAGGCGGGWPGAYRRGATDGTDGTVTAPVCTCTLIDPYTHQPVPNPTCPVHYPTPPVRRKTHPVVGLIVVVVLVGGIAGGLVWYRYASTHRTPAVGDCIVADVGVVPCSSGALRIVAVRNGVGTAVQDDCRSLGAQPFEMADGSETLCAQPER
jgi:hypothetical protein